MVKDERNLEGKTCIFNTHGTDSEWKNHDGEQCKVIRRKPEHEYDFEDVGTMWEIELMDGSTLDAFADELEETQISLDNNQKSKYNRKGENKMEDMSVYSVVVYYTGGSSRGYLVSAEDRNKLMEKLAAMLDYNNVLTVHVGEIFEVEDMMK